MVMKHRTDYEALQALADILVEETLNASDNQILDEVRETYGDENKLADEAKRIFDRAAKEVELKYGGRRTTAQSLNNEAAIRQAAVARWHQAMADGLTAEQAGKVGG